MARQPVWYDDYWLLLMQLYLKKPVGVKPLYSKGLVDLAMELHVHPRCLRRMMIRLDEMEAPGVKSMLERYARNPRRLAREVEKLRGMSGFGDSESFYEGVAVNESFEKSFRPLPGYEPLTEVMLVLILDLYFRLTPQTMVTETPEVADMAKLLRISSAMVVQALRAYCLCDPCLNIKNIEDNPFMEPCRMVWTQHASMEPNELSAKAEALKDYFL